MHCHRSEIATATWTANATFTWTTNSRNWAQSVPFQSTNFSPCLPAPQKLLDQWTLTLQGMSRLFCAKIKVDEKTAAKKSSNGLPPIPGSLRHGPRPFVDPSGSPRGARAGRGSGGRGAFSTGPPDSQFRNSFSQILRNIHQKCRFHRVGCYEARPIDKPSGSRVA